jgi:hypothetical protein
MYETAEAAPGTSVRPTGRDRGPAGVLGEYPRCHRSHELPSVKLFKNIISLATAGSWDDRQVLSATLLNERQAAVLPRSDGAI